MTIPPLTLALLVFAIVGNASANILIKAGAAKIGQTASGSDFIFRAITNPSILFGILLFAVVLGAYSAVLTKVPLSTAYPMMTGLGFVIVALASALLFRETIQPSQLLGMALIVTGVWLVARYLGVR